MVRASPIVTAEAKAYRVVEALEEALGKVLFFCRQDVVVHDDDNDVMTMMIFPHDYRHLAFLVEVFPQGKIDRAAFFGTYRVRASPLPCVCIYHHDAYFRVGMS